MRKNLLWLDDYFDELGEFMPPSADPDLELQNDFLLLSKHFPNTKIHVETTPNGFVQKIVEHERIFYGIKPKLQGACKLDAIVIDIMIDNIYQVPIPNIDPETRKIIFDENGLVKSWVSLSFNENGNNAGLALAQHLIGELESLNRVGIVFYTHRHINTEVSSVIAAIKNTTCVIGHQKAKGIEPLYKTLADLGLS